jgi:hypothetical protein
MGFVQSVGTLLGPEGTLTKVCSPEGETCSAIASYRYDALNRRVEKVVEAPHQTWDRVTRFYYDGWRAIEERAVQGAPGSEVEYVRACAAPRKARCEIRHQSRPGRWLE